MNCVFRKQKSRKASGPDSISPACLKVCADQLAPSLHRSSTDLWSCAKFPAASNAPPSFPSPKSPKSTCLNVYRLVALTSVVMKLLERLVLSYLKDIPRPLLDTLQFSYRANRSVDDAVNMGLHTSCNHLDKPGNYARILLWTLARPSILSCLTFSQTS